MPQMEALIAALHDAGACRLLTVDLIVAAWCDLIIAAAAASEDVGSLLADPMTFERAFGELMAWCIEGRVPQRHCPYVTGGPLITDRAVIERVRRILD
jgi:hypothetical protein